VRIALVAPVDEPIPPRTYGGIEEVVHLLDRGLTGRGHDVVLLASGGSESHGVLVPLTDRWMTEVGRDRRDTGEVEARKEAAAQRAADLLAELHVDVVLNHSWRLIDHLSAVQCPVLTTVHYPLDAGRYRSVFLARQHATYVSISWSQQRALDSLRFAANIYNGIDLDTLPFSPRPEGYLAFLGRASPDKGLDLAIRTAQEVGLPLRVAAKIDGADRPWYNDVVVPLLGDGGVDMIGEVNAAERAALLGGADALLHPSRWSEPFGLAAVEAMACGTPVVALNRGASGEVIGHGTSGVVVDDESALSDAVADALVLSRAACRAHVASRFSHARMVAEYEQLARNAAMRE
jgi:glycosyltransferase involved in cell wall biosynthesis